MKRRRVSARTAFAASLALLVLATAGAGLAGFLITTHHQHADRSRRLAEAAAYVREDPARAESRSWQANFTEELSRLSLDAQLTLVSPASKQTIYVSRDVAETSTREDPTASYQFPASDSASAQVLSLDLYAPALSRAEPLIIGLTIGLVALLLSGAVVMWSVNRCLVAPLRRLSRQVDEIAGGDAGATQISSPIAEVDHVGQAVAGMGDSLSRAAQDDERREAERRLLVSSIAHDLRTPLFSLRGYLDAIEAGIGDPAERLSRARAKAEQIDRLVSELFDYARADLRSQPILHIEDIGDAVAETCMSYTAVANEKAVRLEVRTRSGEEAPIDHDDFQRALANVIDNAVRHTPSGGAVTVDCATDGDHVVVTVTDDGHGIPPELLADLFQPVVRPDSRRPSRADGHVNLGLGLTIAARLLANQGGTIDAANARPRGAVFTLRLPRHTKA